MSTKWGISGMFALSIRKVAYLQQIEDATQLHHYKYCIFALGCVVLYLLLCSLNKNYSQIY
jgi:inner membrane protein involved in colicin E2 resistance